MKTRLGVLLISLIGCSALRAAGSSLDWQTVLRWLFPDTQTLVVASQPFDISQLEDVKKKKRQGVPADALRGFAVGSDFPVVSRLLSGRRVRFAIAGVRSFRDAFWVEGGVYDGCAVIVFAEPLGASLEKALAEGSREELGAIPIFHPRRDTEGEAPLFIAHPLPDTIVVATERKTLEIVLSRRDGRFTERAIPDSLPEWKGVDRAAAVFAIRHIAQSGSRPMSPPEDVEALDWADSRAIGFVYNSTAGKARQTLQYMSGNPKALEIARRFYRKIQSDGVTPEVSLKSPGVIYVTIGTDSSAGIGLFTILLMTSLGFAVVI